MRSWVTLLTADGESGRSGFVSLIGNSSSYTSPYSSLDPMARKRAAFSLPRSDGLQEIHLAHRVGVERFGGRVPRRGHEALRGEVDEVIGRRLLHEMLHGREVAQVALDEVQLLSHVVDVLGLAAPAAGAPHL